MNFYALWNESYNGKITVTHICLFPAPCGIGAAVDSDNACTPPWARHHK